MPAPPVTTPVTPGTQFSAQDFIYGALRLCGAIDAEQANSLTAQELTDGVAALNQMLDSWNADRLSVYTISIQDFPLQASKQVYTLGPGGDFNTARPVRIERASVVLLNNPTQPIERPLKQYLNESEWQAVMVKSVTATFPFAFYDDGAYPLRNLSFWPIPQEVDNFRLYSWQALSQFPDLTTTLTFPPGYYRAIRYNLAVELAPEWSATVPAVVAQIAAAAYAKIAILNSPVKKMVCDDAVRQGGAEDALNYRSELFSIP